MNFYSIRAANRQCRLTKVRTYFKDHPEDYIKPLILRHRWRIGNNGQHYGITEGGAR
jgi:hypothetical protein